MTSETDPSISVDPVSHNAMPTGDQVALPPVLPEFEPGSTLTAEQAANFSQTLGVKIMSISAKPAAEVTPAESEFVAWTADLGTRVILSGLRKGLEKPQSADVLRAKAQKFIDQAGIKIPVGVANFMSVVPELTGGAPSRWLKGDATLRAPIEDAASAALTTFADMVAANGGEMRVGTESAHYLSHMLGLYETVQAEQAAEKRPDVRLLSQEVRLKSRLPH